MLAVGGQAHNVVPVEAALNAMLMESGAKVAYGLGTRAEDGLHRRVQEQGVVVHATDFCTPWAGCDISFQRVRRCPHRQ